MCKKLMFLISLVMLLALVNSASAVSWDGGGADALWATPENWDGDSVPGAGDVARLEPGGSPQNDAEIASDVTVLSVEGPRWDSDDDMALTITSGDSTWQGWRIGYDGDGNSTVNINGGTLTVDPWPGDDWNIRSSDSGELIWNQTGGTVHVRNGRWRTGDNGGTYTEFNISGGLLKMDGEWKWGDDGDIQMTMDGGTIEIGITDAEGEDWIFEARDGENHAVVNDGSIICHADLRLNTHDNYATLTINGGSVECKKIEMPWEYDGDAELTVNGGTFDAEEIVVRHQNALLTVDGGAVECCDLTVENGGVVDILGGTFTVTCIGSANFDGGRVNIEGAGQLILAGDKRGDVEAAAAAGKIGAYWNDTFSVFRGTLNVVFDGENTIVTAIPPDFDKAWGANPASGASEIGSGCDVILSWQPGDSVLTKGRHFVFFGTDEQAVEDCPGIPSPGPEYQGMTFWNILSYNIGPLPLWQTFYWRIDEGNWDGSITKGDVWSFSTGCALIGGDVNLDCLVNFLDYAAVAATWQQEQFFPDGCNPEGDPLCGP
jgi:hypothetical protein